jgi:hypothetical protein
MPTHHQQSCRQQKSAAHLSEGPAPCLKLYPAWTFVRQPGSRKAAHTHGRILIPDVSPAAFVVVPRWNNF